MQNQSNDKRLKKILQERGLRLTKARMLVYIVLHDADAPLSIQQIVDCCTSVHFVSVYRTIEVYLQNGIIKQVPIGFKNKYELSDYFKPHHHHVTCNICGRSTSVNQQSIERLMNTVTRAAGMIPTHHHFEAYGICKTCQASTATSV